MKTARSPKDFIHATPRKKFRLSLRAILYLVFIVNFCLLASFVFLGARNSPWDGQTRLTVVSVIPPGLISFEPKSGKTTLIPFPRGFKLHLTQGYGDYLFDNVSKLDQQEKKGGHLLLSSVENVFGLPVVTWITQDKPRQMQPSLSDILFGKTHSGFSFFDQLRFSWLINFQSRANIRSVDLSTDHLIKAQNNIDGTVDLVLVGDRWDQWMRKNLFDPSVDSEKITVTVINHTNHQGLGNQVARQIENIGASVVRVISGDEPQVHCTITGAKNFVSTKTVSIIRRLFSCRWIEGDSSSQRADIVVNIGEDYWRFLDLND